MTFGEKMRALMTERGISLRSLAKTIPADAGGLSKISNDLKRPSKALAERIDAVLDAGGELAALRPPGVRDALNGQFTPDDEERLRLAVQRPSRIDARVVDSLAVILAEQRRLEDSIGSAAVLHAVRAQLQTIDALVAEARGPIRPRVVDVAAQWAQFSGWLHIAVDDPPAARMSLDRAAEHAEEIGDTDMIGTVLSWKGHLAERRGEIGPMVGLSAAAQRHRRGPGRVYDVFQEARGHALAGDTEHASRLLDAARITMTEANAADAREWEYYYLLPGFFDLEVGLTLIHLGRIDTRRNIEAVDVISAGLAALPEGTRRSEWAGQYITHQALSYLQADEAEAACDAAREATGIARATSSGTLLRQLRSVHREIRVKWPTCHGLAELGEALR